MHRRRVLRAVKQAGRIRRETYLLLSWVRAQHSCEQTVPWSRSTCSFGAEALGVDIDAIETSTHDGTAFARLARDYQDADKMRIEGSPSFVLNEGRQKLYGNVGFRIIEANIQELLRTPGGDQASWC